MPDDESALAHRDGGVGTTRDRPDAIDATRATLLDVLKTSYRMLRGGEATPSPALKRRRSAGTPFAKATNRAARQDMP